MLNGFLILCAIKSTVALASPCWVPWRLKRALRQLSERGENVAEDLMRVAVPFILLGLCGGCSRAYYRQAADRETYGAIAERAADPRWALPCPCITPPPQSRLYDPFDPDYPPMPPEDLAAHRYMNCVDGMKGYNHALSVKAVQRRKGYPQDQPSLPGDAAHTAPPIEAPHWRQYLCLGEDGTLPLTPQGAVELGVLHSREYRTFLEEVYFAALALTLERFEFDLHWFGRNSTTFTQFGSGPTERNTLTTDTNAGFSRAFSTGGQLLVDFANSFVFEFSGTNHSTVSSNILITLVQPLLRRAGREIRLEQLTQAERAVLYSVRDFARFQKEFYVNITSGSGGFLSLLLQVQNIRDQEQNLRSLEQDLRLHQALFEIGTVSSVQVDQVFQSYQQGRLALLQTQTGFESALDAFKITLGLPPDLPVSLDNALLAPFQLNDPAVIQLQDEIEKSLAEYRKFDKAPPLAELRKALSRLKGYQDRALKLLEQVSNELGRLETQPAGPAEDGGQTGRRHAASQQLANQLGELRKDLAAFDQALAKATTALHEGTQKESWQALQKLGRQQLNLVAQLFVIQTQARVALIRLRPVSYEEHGAVEYALANRLDLMNQQARVVDAWRKITVAADGLESDFDIIFNADIATKPGGTNPVDFRASASSYRVGFQFNSPLNRLLERNVYRASLINYQRARRAYMALADQIRRAVRQDLRQLQTERLNFDIARQSLITAARQVEATRDRLLLLANAGDSSSTQDVLNALNTLLQARNTLIGSWVNYERNRIQLLFDLELVGPDTGGVFTNEYEYRSEATTGATLGRPHAVGKAPP
jgi:outer membrane protein TolC